MLIIPDRKGEFGDLAIGFELNYFLRTDFHDNWCACPPGVDPILWLNQLAEILANAFELRVAGQAQLLEMLIELCDGKDPASPDYPTLFDLRDRILAQLRKGRK